MIVEAWSEKIALHIKKANEEETVSIEVMKFALIILINFMIPVCISLLIGLITGKLMATSISILAFVLLRMASGGFHFQSPIVCMISTTIVTAAPPHIALSHIFIYIFTAISLLLVLIKAPSNLKGYNRMPERFYPYLKLVSAILVCINFIFVSSSVAVVFLIQGILLFKNVKEV
ncbi:accessory gene regulator ArgB-like protein [Paenibacillus hodogayensis]|uniref:Accessory gene regulator ArgB-like protein n=1 Tax=Paenibacillus hodogayensis TaxID=279208 RepID=A0ABV5VZU1_9BACL